jgi:hypothetical protein
MLFRSKKLDGVMRIRTWIVFLSLFLVAASLMSGCLGERTTLAPPVEPPKILVDYQRTGGLAGFSDRLVIFDNGVALISTRKVTTEIALNQSELERINALFSTSGFVDSDTNYTSARGGADLLQYRISYNGMTVYTEDTAIPGRIQPILDEMNRIVADVITREKANSPLPRINP